MLRHREKDLRVVVLILAAGLCLFVLAMAAPPSAPAKGRGRFGVLVVGNARDVGSVQRAGMLAATLRTMLKREGYSSAKLPLLLLDIGKIENAAMAAGLGIAPGDTVFAGVVRLDASDYPVEVLHRHNRVRDVQAVATRVVAQVEVLVRPPVPTPRVHPTSVPTPQGPPRLTPNGTNAQGYSEYRSERDGSTFIAVPGGTFTMGSDESADEKPPHSVTVASFYVGKYDVTNLQFRRFVDATGYDAGSQWKSYAEQWGGNAPVVSVSWHDANAYCRWAGMRLPTEAEYEYVARGREGRKYPWGNEWDATRCCNSSNSNSHAAAVGSYPSGASWCGALDVVGNVWQWCSSKYQPYPYDARDGREDPSGNVDRVLRGGSWINGSCYRGAYRGYLAPGFRSGSYGFRGIFARGPE